MKGIGIWQYGDEACLQEVQLSQPEVGENDLLVSIEASGVNPVDWKVCEGKLQHDFPFELPIIPGWDAAGSVIETGKKVRQFKAGDQVFFRPLFERYGTYADLAIVPASIVAKKPANITAAEAASLPLAGLTAWQAIVEAGKVQPGENVVILAGSGGVGSLAIQIAKARGALVSATTSSRNRDFVLSLGADEIITYDTGQTHHQRSFDFMFDTLGGDAYAEALAWMKPCGRVATIISHRDAVRTPAADELEKQLQITTEFVFTRPDGNNMNHLRELVEQGKLKPIVTEIYPLTVGGVRKAHLSSRTGRTKGKIVLTRQLPHEEN